MKLQRAQRWNGEGQISKFSSKASLSLIFSLIQGDKKITQNHGKLK